AERQQRHPALDRPFGHVADVPRQVQRSARISAGELEQRSREAGLEALEVAAVHSGSVPPASLGCNRLRLAGAALPPAPRAARLQRKENLTMGLLANAADKVLLWIHGRRLGLIGDGQGGTS